MTVTPSLRSHRILGSAGSAAPVLSLILTGCAGAPELDTTTDLAAPDTVTRATDGTPGDSHTDPETNDSAEAAQFPIEIASCGHTSTLETAPTRALTLNQGATEVMLALGLEDSMAGTAYLDDAVTPEFQEAYDSVPVLSDSYPSHEAILAAEPDFIYASYASAFEAEVAGTQNELQSDGIASYLSPFGCSERDQRPQASFEAVWDEVSAVAVAFGVPDRANDLRETQQQTLDSIATAGEGVSVLWWDSGTDAPFVGAGSGAPQLVMDAVGATNIFANLEGNWADGNWEDVLSADPDVIILIDAGWDTAQDKEAHLKADPVLSQLTAVENDTFVTLPFSESTAGVRLVDGAESLADQLTSVASTT